MQTQGTRPVGPASKQTESHTKAHMWMKAKSAKFSAPHARKQTERLEHPGRKCPVSVSLSDCKLI